MTKVPATFAGALLSAANAAEMEIVAMAATNKRKNGAAEVPNTGPVLMAKSDRALGPQQTSRKVGRTYTPGEAAAIATTGPQSTCATAYGSSRNTRNPFAG